MGVFKCHTISYEKRFAIVCYKSKDKSYSKISKLWGYSKSAVLLCAKSSSRTVKHLLWVGRPEKCMKIFERHENLPVLELLMWVHYYAVISG